MSTNLEARVRELEDQLARVTANRDDILREKRELEGRPAPKLSETDRLLRAADKVLAIDNGADRFNTVSQVVVERHADHATYVEAKAKAEKLGVPLVFADGNSDPALAGNARPAESNVRFVEDERTYYAHQAMQRQVGVVELSRRAAEKGKRLHIFRTPEDLSPDARARHDRIVAEGDPDNLLLPEPE